MPVTLHAATDHRPVEDVHGCAQGGPPVALIVVGHRSGPAFLHRQARLGSVERLDASVSPSGGRAFARVSLPRRAFWPRDGTAPRWACLSVKRALFLPPSP